MQVAQTKVGWPAIPCVRAFGRDVKAYMNACKGDAQTGMRHRTRIRARIRHQSVSGTPSTMVGTCR